MTSLRLVSIPTAASPASGRPGYRPVDGHDLRIVASDVLPLGWPEAWVWNCGCGAESDSIMRTRADAVDDHRSEHLDYLDTQENR